MRRVFAWTAVPGQATKAGAARLVGPAAALMSIGLLLIGIPRHASDALLSLLTVAGMYALVAQGVGLLMGYAGLVSLAQAAFFGLGAYGSALLTTRGLEFSPWLAMGIVAAGNAALAWVSTLFLARLPGHMYSLGTLALGIIVQVGFLQLKGVTGGALGFSGIPSLTVAGYPLHESREYYVVVWGIALLGMWIARNLMASLWGRKLLALQWNEIALQATGVNPLRLKASVFAVAAAYASAAGSLYAHYLGFLEPGVFGFIASVEFVLMSTLGGNASVVGPAVGATLFVLLRDFMRALVPRLIPGATGEYEIILFGLLLILLVRAAPQGIVGTFGDLVVRQRVHAAASGRWIEGVRG